MTKTEANYFVTKLEAILPFKQYIINENLLTKITNQGDDRNPKYLLLVKLESKLYLYFILYIKSI